MARALVIGGGTGGLAAALLLSRDGHDVSVLERDVAPPPASPDQAFRSWRRPGAPQLWHSHAFLARLRNLLRERAPDVLAALLEAGATELRFPEGLPPGVTDRRPHAGDEDLVLLACRRVTFEWVLRRAVAAERGVRWWAGARVVGLDAEPVRGGVPRVRGVRVRGASEAQARADLVIDASGRGSSILAWLRELGAAPPIEHDEDAGIFYASRFYRLRPGVDPPVGQGVVGADLGYMKVGLFPGDAGTFSVTLASLTDDDEMRQLLRPGPFAAAAAALPATRDWVDPERSEPISRLRGMARLRNRRRLFVCDDRPLVLGLHVLGDAAICTNPLYGRGCSLAFVQAGLLADALRDHPHDPDACGLAFAEATQREIGPWYRAARDQDRDALEVAAAERRGDDPFEAQGPDGRVDPRATVRGLFRDGLLPLLASDAEAVRIFARGFNLLEPPESLMANPALLPRVLAAYAERHRRATPAAAGPPREEMVRVLDRAAA